MADIIRITEFGFERSNGTTKNKEYKLITRKDGFTNYLLIIDEQNRYIRIFLFAKKESPIETITIFVNTHGLKDCLRQVHTDQGGKLARRIAIYKYIQKAGYTLERTGASFHLLTSSNLLSGYWIHTIQYTCYEMK